MLRDAIQTATTQAMKARDSARLGALRLINAALKNKDIELRTGTAPADDDSNLPRRRKAETAGDGCCAARRDRRDASSTSLWNGSGMLKNPMSSGFQRR